MQKKLLPILFLLTVYSLPVYADQTEELPDAAKTKNNIEKQELNNNAPKEASKDLPLAKPPEGWTNSLKEAITRAKSENKYIMALFTGSDWCEYCNLLDEEVFKTAAFKEWSDNNVIKLYLDFPKYHSLPENISAQNIAISQRLGVQGFPTAVFFTPQGQPLTSLGYLPGGGETWVKQVEMLLPKTLKVQTSLTSAVSSSAMKNIPLFLGIYDSKSSSAEGEKEAIDKVFASPELSLPSGKEIILAKIDYSSLNNKEKELLGKISSPNVAPEFILLNSNREPLFDSKLNQLKPAELVHKVTDYIKKPEYDGKWLQDYSQGLKLARLYNKPILLFFTGSDWCGYCEEMQKNIFKTEEFAKKSKDYILVELDYPRTFELPDKIKLQNEVILNAFNIQGFPTVVVEKSNGMPIGGVGYNSQTVSEFFNTIEQSLNNS